MWDGWQGGESQQASLRGTKPSADMGRGEPRGGEAGLRGWRKSRIFYLKVIGRQELFCGG